MDLNKANKDIYTVDRDSYSEYMQESSTGTKDLLSSFIKLLLFVLLILLSYFFYKIVKADLSFSEVFNKKELIATYKLFKNDDKEIYIKKEDYADVLAKNIAIEEPTKTTLLAITQKYAEPVVVKEEVVKVEKKPVIVVLDIVEEQKKEIKIEVVAPVVVNVMPSEVKINKEERELNVLSDSYLERMVEELNSI
jgi:hypothetical protein